MDEDEQIDAHTISPTLYCSYNVGVVQPSVNEPHRFRNSLGPRPLPALHAEQQGRSAYTVAGGQGYKTTSSSYYH